MKNKLFLLLFLPIVMGCSNKSNKTTKTYELDNTSMTHSRHYDIYTLDGCEYIVVGINDSKWGSHKGNCKNPIHQKNENDKQF